MNTMIHGHTDSWMVFALPKRPALRIAPLVIESLEARTLLSLTTQLVKDLNTQPVGVQVSGSIVEMGNVGYSAGNDGIHGLQLFKVDGSGGSPTLVKDSVPNPSNLTNVNGTLYFGAGGLAGTELWKSDA